MFLTFFFACGKQSEREKEKIMSWWCSLWYLPTTMSSLKCARQILYKINPSFAFKLWNQKYECRPFPSGYNLYGNLILSFPPPKLLFCLYFCIGHANLHYINLSRCSVQFSSYVQTLTYTITLWHIILNLIRKSIHEYVEVHLWPKVE